MEKIKFKTAFLYYYYNYKINFKKIKLIKKFVIGNIYKYALFVVLICINLLHITLYNLSEYMYCMNKRLMFRFLTNLYSTHIYIFIYIYIYIKH